MHSVLSRRIPSLFLKKTSCLVQGPLPNRFHWRSSLEQVASSRLTWFCRTWLHRALMLLERSLLLWTPRKRLVQHFCLVFRNDCVFWNRITIKPGKSEKSLKLSHCLRCVPAVRFFHEVCHIIISLAYEVIKILHARFSPDTVIFCCHSEWCSSIPVSASFSLCASRVPQASRWKPSDRPHTLGCITSPRSCWGIVSLHSSIGERFLVFSPGQKP